MGELISSGWDVKTSPHTDCSDAHVRNSALEPERHPVRRARAWTGRRCPSTVSSAAGRALSAMASGRPMTGRTAGGSRRAGRRSPISTHRATTPERWRIVPLARVLRRPPVRSHAPDRGVVRGRHGGEKRSRRGPNQGPHMVPVCPHKAVESTARPTTFVNNHRGFRAKRLPGVPLVMRRSRVRFPKAAPPPRPMSTAFWITSSIALDSGTGIAPEMPPTRRAFVHRFVSMRYP